jgi:hypothetical protein
MLLVTVLIYTTLEGTTYDIDELAERERSHFDRCWTLYQRATHWAEFGIAARSPDNPLVQVAGAILRRDHTSHPLRQVIDDLDERLGIAEGRLVAPQSFELGDPFRDNLHVADPLEGRIPPGFRDTDTGRSRALT